MKLTREQIDSMSDGELAAYAGEHVGHHCNLAVSSFAVMDAAGRRGWQMILVHRSGLGLESIASVQYVPGYRAEHTCRHPRAEVAIFRAFLYAVAGNPPAPAPDAPPADN